MSSQPKESKKNSFKGINKYVFKEFAEEKNSDWEIQHGKKNTLFPLVFYITKLEQFVVWKKENISTLMSKESCSLKVADKTFPKLLPSPEEITKEPWKHYSDVFDETYIIIYIFVFTNFCSEY